MAFFWPFLGEKCGFLVIAAPKNSISCSKTLQNTFLGVPQTESRVGGPQLPTQAPKTLFKGKKSLFLAIFGQKMGFFW